jgi:8-oxo-dGTP pyrophosphatase MutT (NUDIX family)
MPGWMIAEVKATCDIPWEIIDAWSGDYSQVRTLFAKYIGDRQYYISQFPIDILRKTVDAKIDKCNQEAIKKIAIFSNEASEEEKNLFILTIIRQFVGRAQCDWLDVYPVLNSIAVAIINDSEYSEMVTHILDVLFNIEFESNRNTLIKIKLNPNERGDKECADLFWVACELKHDRVDVLQCLIKHGGEVERFGLQYLTVAAGQGNNECVKYLARFKLDMQCRIRVDENAEYLSNPLAIYVKNNNMEMLRYLLDNGFDSNFIPKSNKMALTALDGALFLDNREITLFLLERGASADKMVLWPLILGNEGVKEDVLSKECFPLIFPILPAAEDLEDYFIPEHSYVTTASVAIVTGVDKQGDPFVILGKRKEDFFKSTIKSNYTFPGGLRNVGEPFSACAIREASEELGLPDLKSCIKDITCIYTYEDKFKYVKFYHINVGNSLAEKPVYAQDDFLLARKVSFKNIRFSEEYEGIVELRNGQLFLSKSTALLLKNIISKGKIDAKNDLIKISLLIEYEETLGEELFIKKLKAGDFLTMQTFVLLGFRVTPFVVKEALVTLYGSSENYRRIEIVNADETIKFLMENLNLKYCQQTHFDFFERKNHEKPCVLTEIWKLLKPNDITVDILNCLIAYGFDGNKISNLNIYDKEKLMLELIKSPSKTAVIEKIFSLGYSVYNPYELYLSAIIDFENEYKEEVTDHSIAIKNNIKTVRDYYKIEIPKSLIDIFKYCRGYSKIALNRLKDLLFEHQFCVEKLPASKELDTAISTIISCSLDEYKYQPLVLNTILDAFIEIKLPISDLSTLKWKISWYAGPLRRDGIDVDRIEEKLSKLVSISTRGSLGPQFG